MHHVSASRGYAPAICPVCPEADEVDAVAQVDGYADERAPFASLEDFECERGHSINDLTTAQERAILDSALDWISEALDAMRSAADDARFDSYREEGL